MKKEFVLVIISAVLILSVMSFASAGLGSWFGKFTGKATSQPVDLNVTVTASGPQIIAVTPQTPVNLNEGPSTTVIVVNFSVYLPSGAYRLDNSSSAVNVTAAGEPMRVNGCTATAMAGKYANYSCSITMYWYDRAGTWDVSASIYDLGGKFGMNASQTLNVNALTGFVSGPSPILWSTLSAGQANATAINDALILNNTGNQNISTGNINMNATDLLGETDNLLKLYSGNFSVAITTGGAPPTECGGDLMNHVAYTALTGAYLNRGNFVVNDGTTGQEQAYFCITRVGDELTDQSYSTLSEGPWTVKIS
jgi:hypothetical protein